MASVAPLLGHFDAGEISPRMMGRVDSDRYKSALAKCFNWIPTLQGDLLRRPGTYYVGNVKNSTQKVRLIPFSFSTTQSYVLEFGPLYIRFWTNYGQLLSNSSPYEVSSPYTANDLALLKFTQSADTLYIVHPNYAPRKLQRFDVTTWQLNTITFVDGPYLPINSTPITMTPGAASGTAVTVTAGPAQSITSITFTGSGAFGSLGTAVLNIPNHGWTKSMPISISGVTGTGATDINQYWGTGNVQIQDANNIVISSGSFNSSLTGTGGTLTPAPFLDAGPIIRIETGSTWGWGTITATSAPYTTATVNVQSAFGGVTASTSWRVGLWNTNNYPGCVGFHEDRLCFSGTPSNPQRIDMSNSSNYETFSPSQANGTVQDNNSCNFSLNANDVNAIQWISSDEKGMLAGSTRAEWLLRPSINAEAITPTNVNAKRSTKWGSAVPQAIQIGKATLHIMRGGRRLRELVYSFYIDGFSSTDLNELSDHITGSGVVDVQYTAIPYPIVWLLRNDGALVGMTYDRDFQQLRVGWHAHQLGGQSDGAGSPPIIENICVIPSPDGTRDDVWMVVNRWIGGATVRSFEYMTKVFEDIDLQQNAFQVDCGLTYNNPITMSGATKANPCVITATSHGLSTGNQVRFDSVVGMTQLNGNVYTITVIDANTFSLNGINSTTFNTYVSGGQVRKLITTLSGLSAFNGETFAVWADGVAQTSKTVSSGSITLDSPAAVVSVGYGYNSDGQILRIEGGSRNGTSLGKKRRIHRIGLLVHRAAGLLLGKDFSSLDSVTLGDPPSTGLYTGVDSRTAEFDEDFDNQLCFRVSNPSPCRILAIMPQMETQDNA